MFVFYIINVFWFFETVSFFWFFKFFVCKRAVNKKTNEAGIKKGKIKRWLIKSFKFKEKNAFAPNKKKK